MAVTYSGTVRTRPRWYEFSWRLHRRRLRKQVARNVAALKTGIRAAPDPPSTYPRPMLPNPEEAWAEIKRRDSFGPCGCSCPRH